MALYIPLLYMHECTVMIITKKATFLSTKRVIVAVPIGNEAVKIITVNAHWQFRRILLNDLLQLLKWVFPSIIWKLSCSQLNLQKQHTMQL